jgi:hypothetical protein
MRQQSNVTKIVVTKKERGYFQNAVKPWLKHTSPKNQHHVHVCKYVNWREMWVILQTMLHQGLTGCTKFLL